MVLTRIEELSRLAEERSKVYGFLSSLYLNVPTVDFTKKLMSKECSLLLDSLISKHEVAEGIKEGVEKIRSFINASIGKPVEEVCEKLNVAYARLFRGLKEGYSPPPPYESVYREGRVMGESTVEVMREYSEANAEILDAYKGRMPDSIELELGFMNFLCSKEADALRKEKEDEALKWLEKEKEFLENHILQWVPEFCHKVEEFCKEMEEPDFYLGVIKMTESFLRSDYDLVCSIIDFIKMRRLR